MSAELEPPVRGLQLAVAALGLGLLVALGAAVAQEELAEWKVVQRRYNALAKAAGKPPIAVRIRQAWKPSLELVDRCASCHLAMADAEALPGEPLFAEHGPLPHDPRELGCTTCHGGDGRATSAAAAHGERDQGGEPLLAKASRDVGCGACHSGLRTPSAPLAARGAKLFADYACADCHRGKLELRHVGVQALPEDWHDRHLGRVLDGVAFAPLADEDVPAVAEHLKTLVGAPKLMAGKQLAAERGCRGCHRIGGAGGEDGPDLTAIGLRSPENLPAGAGRGEALLARHAEHLLDPPGRTPGSRMPKLGLTQAEADLLAGFIVSLRPRALPEALLPRDRLRVTRLGERDFATDGESIYAAFCSACHGLRGMGRDSQDVLGPVPSVAQADFLALADDPFLVKTISEGRPGRRMPAWATTEGALRPQEVKAVVAHLRSLEPPAPSFEAVKEATADLALGRRTFALRCAPCHGAAGEGTEVGPPLAASDNVVTMDDSRIYGTLATGVAGTAMGAFRMLDAPALRSVISVVQALPRLPLSRKTWKATPGDPGRGAALFAQHCATCHGKSGEGEKGPALGNPALAAVASDGFFTGTIVRGRPGTKMPSFGTGGPEHARLTAAEVADLVALLRSGVTPRPLRAN